MSAVAAAAASAAASTASSTSGVEEDGAADGDEDAKTGVKAEKDVEVISFAQNEIFGCNILTRIMSRHPSSQRVNH